MTRGDTVYIESTLLGRSTITPAVVERVGRNWFTVRGHVALFSIADGSLHPAELATYLRVWFSMDAYTEERWRVRHVYGITSALARADVATLRKVAELIGYTEG